MKKLKPVNIQIDDCMDADHYGHRLTECIEEMSENTNVVNLVKVRLGDNISVGRFSQILKSVANDIREMGAKNCIYVPLKKGLIEDITVEYIEVVNVSTCGKPETKFSILTIASFIWRIVAPVGIVIVTLRRVLVRSFSSLLRHSPPPPLIKSLKEPPSILSIHGFIVKATSLLKILL